MGGENKCHIPVSCVEFFPLPQGLGKIVVVAKIVVLLSGTTTITTIMNNKDSEIQLLLRQGKSYSDIVASLKVSPSRIAVVKKKMSTTTTTTTPKKVVEVVAEKGANIPTTTTTTTTTTPKKEVVVSGLFPLHSCNEPIKTKGIEGWYIRDKNGNMGDTKYNTKELAQAQIRKNIVAGTQQNFFL